MVKYIFIVNPIAGKGRGKKIAPELKSILDNSTYNYELFFTSKKNDAMNFVSGLPKSENYFVIAVGGDGTVNEIVNGFGENSKNTLGVLPIGSGNDFARSINLLGDWKLILNSILKSNLTKTIDLGLINFTESNNTVYHQRYFACNCGIGFDAQVAYIANQNSILRGLPLYLLSVFKTMRIFKSADFSGSFDNFEFDGKKLLIAIGNGVTSGGGFKLNPNANNSDGLLDFCIAKDMSNIDILKVLPKAIGGNHLTSRLIEYGTFSKSEFSVSDPVYIHIDGEVVSRFANQIKIEIIPKSLKVIVRD
ncbi:MAG: diacylglycerol kinase family lipid kinase [Ignavibacteria bacterium]|nr:diacylglycerol kinase family lipid kinase [Ignavibacteria bacterium]